MSKGTDLYATIVAHEDYVRQCLHDAIHQAAKDLGEQVKYLDWSSDILIGAELKNAA